MQRSHVGASGFGFAVGTLVMTGVTLVAAQTIDPSQVSRPSGTSAAVLDPSTVLSAGVKRHGDTRLSPIERRSCDTCHANPDSYNATFVKPWPHPVASVKTKTGLDQITAEGMVQFCMISAMGAKPLAWDSDALTELTAFVLDRHAKVVEK